MIRARQEPRPPRFRESDIAQRADRPTACRNSPRTARVLLSCSALQRMRGARVDSNESDPSTRCRAKLLGRRTPTGGDTPLSLAPYRSVDQIRARFRELNSGGLDASRKSVSYKANHGARENWTVSCSPFFPPAARLRPQPLSSSLTMIGRRTVPALGHQSPPDDRAGIARDRAS